MLFSSYFFILIFLPFSIFFYFICARINAFAGLLGIVLVSSVFYAWHNPSALLLIFSSILINFYAARLIVTNKHPRKIFFSTLVLDVLFLVFFKYLDFSIQNFNCVFSCNLPLYHFPLPLAISFFTFQQIGFLVDVYKKREGVPSLIEYSSFILFFPQLIAGPIIKHTDYLPQIQKLKTFLPSVRNLSIGSTIFALGLFKKAILADSAGFYADRVFDIAGQGIIPNLVESWIGILSYSFQIYFDFSGYSDMAIGLARIFNIHLPLNFFSPYKSQSIIEFWRRWHISLSNFLKEQIYIPLGGNKKGVYLRYQNLMITMLIGGLWHGASWTFVIWGGLHGFYLIINHLIRKVYAGALMATSKIVITLKRVCVFILVSLTWLFFRAKDLMEVKLIFSSLFSLKHLVLTNNYIKMGTKLGFDMSPFQGKFHLQSDVRNPAIVLLLCLSIVTFFAPTVYEWIGYFLPAKDFVKTSYMKNRLFKIFCWKPTWVFGIFVFIIMVIAFGNINSKNEFVYFQF